MKKLSALLLSAALIMSLTACGEPEVSDGDGMEREPETEESPESRREISFEGMGIFDSELFFAEIFGIEPEAPGGYTLKTRLINRSEDKPLTLAVSGAAVNGVQTEPFFACTLEPGEEKESGICFPRQDRQETGEYSDIMLNFVLYSPGDWSGEGAESKSVHVYPFGEAEAFKYVREPQEGDIVLYEGDELSVTLTGEKSDRAGGREIFLYLENRGGEELIISAGDVMLNSVPADPHYLVSLLPGLSYMSSMSWSPSEAGEAGEELNISFRLIVKSAGGELIADELIECKK